MIVTTSNKVLVSVGNKMLVNDSINEFLGTVSNLWNNPLNWSLGVLPTANQTAIIRADCQANITTTVKNVIISNEVTLLIVLNLTINRSLISYGNLINNGVLYSLILGNENFQISNYSGTGTIYYDGDPNGTREYLNQPPTTIFRARIHQYIKLIYDDVIFPGNSVSTATIGQRGSLWIKNKITLPDGGNIGGNGQIYSDTPVNIIIYKNLVQGANSFNLAEGSVIEFKGKADGLGGSSLYGTTSLALVKFNTYNQRLYSDVNQNTQGTMRDIEVENVTVELLSGRPSPFTNQLNVTRSLNGIDANSIFIVGERGILNYGGDATSDLMSIGKFKVRDGSIVQYSGQTNKNIRVPDEGSYKELRLTGAGVRKLTGNITCEHLYFAGTATLDLNGFALTGYIKYTDARATNSTVPSGTFEFLSFSHGQDAGTKTLLGNITADYIIVSNSAMIFNYNGFTIDTPLWNFNRSSSQNIPAGNYQNIRFGYEPGTYDAKIFNGVTVNVSGSTTFGVPIVRILYANSGIFTTNNLVFDYVGNQNVFGNCNFTNLEIKGSGIKTLTTNIVVNGTYYRDTVNTTLNKNGFTIKDANGNDLE